MWMHLIISHNFFFSYLLFVWFSLFSKHWMSVRATCIIAEPSAKWKHRASCTKIIRKFKMWQQSIKLSAGPWVTIDLGIKILCPFSIGVANVFLVQESVNVFCRGPDSKYFRLWRLYGHLCKYSTLLLQHKSSHW